MLRQKNYALGLQCLALLLPAAEAQAQLAPAPKRSPRTPVNQQLLVTPAPALPVSRLVEGQAIVMDSEHLKIDKIEMRLFGVVPPLLSASFGPQARNVIDALAKGTVTCRVRDRDREGHLLASCHNGDNLDFGMELLRRGLAVTARGTLHGTELATTYVAAEEAAKSQRLGLWSVSQPNAASNSSIRQAAQEKKEDAKAETKPEAKAPDPKAAEATTPDVVVPVSQEALQATPPQTKPAEPAASQPPALQGDLLAKAQQQTAQEILDAYPAAEEPDLTTAEDSRGFVEKYQLLLTGLLLFGAASAAAFGFVFNRKQERKQEVRAIAAALRGELSAARSICLARLSKMAHDGEERSVAWPRLRSLVFQAYVGQIGKLGADLARQIASIYGQSSDYASYYVGADDRPEAASKKQSLQTLVQHIEDVMPRLTNIERTGDMPMPPKAAHPQLSLWGKVVRPISLVAPSLPKLPGKVKWPTKSLPAIESIKETPTESASNEAAHIEEQPIVKEAPVAKKFKEAPVVEEVEVAEKEPEIEAVKEPAKEKTEIQEKASPATEAAEVIAEKKAEPAVEKKAQEETAQTQDKPKPFPSNTPLPPGGPSRRPGNASRRSTTSAVGTEHKKPTEQTTTQKTASAQKGTSSLMAAAKATTAKTTSKEEGNPLWQVAQEIDLKTPLTEQISRFKSFAQEKWSMVKPRLSSSIEDIIPDYANLTEEELEALSYEDDDFFLDDYRDDYRKAG